MAMVFLTPAISVMLATILWIQMMTVYLMTVMSAPDIVTKWIPTTTTHLMAATIALTIRVKPIRRMRLQRCRYGFRRRRHRQLQRQLPSSVHNPGQEDGDTDGIGDACEPLLVKQEVRDNSATLLPTGDKKTDDRIEKAIESIEDSLEDKYWADDSHLVEKGKKVFDEEKKAVKELMNVDQPDVSGLIDSLVYDADEVLALVAIEEAVGAAMGCPGNHKPKDCDKALKEITKAHEERTEAQEDLDKGDPDKAIDHYKKAWEHAQKALDKLT